MACVYVTGGLVLVTRRVLVQLSSHECSRLEREMLSSVRSPTYHTPARQQCETHRCGVVVAFLRDSWIPVSPSWLTCCGGDSCAPTHAGTQSNDTHRCLFWRATVTRLSVDHTRVLTLRTEIWHTGPLHAASIHPPTKLKESTRL